MSGEMVRAAPRTPELRRRGVSRFYLDWLVASVGAMAILIAINPEYFSGSRRFFGPHDTQIPYQAALNAAQSWWGSGVSLWNWYDQVDMAYSHLTTGWWTIPSMLEGVVLAGVDAAVQLNGLEVLRIHAWLWTLLQVLVASFGLVALLRDLGIRSTIAVPLAALGVGYLTAVSTFYYLTGFIYALIPLLILLTRRMLARPKPKILLTWLLLGLVIVAQSPLFAIGYAFIPVFFFALSTVIVEMAIAWRGRCMKAKWRRWFRGLRLGAWTAMLRTPSGLVLLFSVCLLGSALAAVYVPLLRSFSANLYVVENRLDNGLWNLDWLRQAVQNGADPTIALQASLNGSASTGWSYWGLMWPALALLGVVLARKRAFLPFAITAGLIFFLQLNTLGPWSLWPLSVPVRTLVFFAYPGSGLFHRATMVTLMLPYLVIPLAAAAIQVATRSRGPTGSPARRRTLVFVLAAVAAGLGWSLGQFAPRPYLASTVLALMFIAAMLFGGLVIFRITNQSATRPAWVLLVVLLLATTGTDVALLRTSWSVPAYFGGSVEPRTFTVEEIRSGQFVPDYRAVQRKNTAPVVYAGPLPTVDPQSPSLMVPEDPTAQYFNRQTNSGLFWSANVLGRYGQDQYYQQVHRTLRDYTVKGQPLEPASVPPAVTLLGVDVNGACTPHRATLADTLPVRTGIALPLAGSHTGANIWHPKAVVDVEVPWPTSLPPWRTNVFALGNGNQAFANGVPLTPVQGYPTEPFSFDVGNWRNDTLTIAWPADEPLPTTAAIYLTPQTSQAIESLQLQRNTIAARVDSAEPSCFVAFQPWQPGWVALVDGAPAAVEDVEGWVAVRLSPGAHDISVTYALYGRWTDAVPFILPGLALLGLVLVMVRTFRDDSRLSTSTYMTPGK